MTVRCVPGLLAAALFACVFAGTLAPRAAVAQQQPNPFAEPAGTVTQRDACQNDALTLCREFVPNVAAVEACLKRNIKKISTPCRVVMGGNTWKKKRSAAAGQ